MISPLVSVGSGLAKLLAPGIHFTYYKPRRQPWRPAPTAETCLRFGGIPSSKASNLVGMAPIDFHVLWYLKLEGLIFTRTNLQFIPVLLIFSFPDPLFEMAKPHFWRPCYSNYLALARLVSLVLRGACFATNGSGRLSLAGSQWVGSWLLHRNGQLNILSSAGTRISSFWEDPVLQGPKTKMHHRGNLWLDSLDAQKNDRV